jgi:hypothetical protein
MIAVEKLNDADAGCRLSCVCFRCCYSFFVESKDLATRRKRRLVRTAELREMMVVDEPAWRLKTLEVMVVLD